jgi:hypothetical protein
MGPKNKPSTRTPTDEEIPVWAEAFQAKLLTSIEGMIEMANMKLQKVIEADLQKSSDFLQESLQHAELETKRLGCWS